MILKKLPLGVRVVVDEESLSVVTSAPKLLHNKTCWVQKNDSRVDYNFTLEAKSEWNHARISRYITARTDALLF
jgi:hypothetical protein